MDSKKKSMNFCPNRNLLKESVKFAKQDKSDVDAFCVLNWKIGNLSKVSFDLVWKK